MATTDEVIGDALTGLEALRPGVELLGTFDPKSAAIVGVALSLVYEGLVALRQALLNDTTDVIRDQLAAKAERAIQELAAIKFGAVPRG